MMTDDRRPVPADRRTFLKATGAAALAIGMPLPIPASMRNYVQKCPARAVSLEVIVTSDFRLFNYRDRQAWELFKTTPAWEFSRFLALADRGIPKPLPAPGQGRDAGPGRGAQPNPGAQWRNLEDAEASVKWTQDFLATL